MAVLWHVVGAVSAMMKGGGNGWGLNGVGR